MNSSVGHQKTRKEINHENYEKNKQEIKEANARKYREDPEVKQKSKRYKELRKMICKLNGIPILHYTAKFTKEERDRYLTNAEKLTSSHWSEEDKLDLDQLKTTYPDILQRLNEPAEPRKKSRPVRLPKEAVAPVEEEQPSSSDDN